MLSSVYLHWKTKIVLPSLIKGLPKYLNFYEYSQVDYSFWWSCPLCQREIGFLKSRNQEANLKFIDINSPDLSSELEYGITYKQAMERIHAIKNDGSVIKDIKLLQEAYDLIWLN